MSSDPEDNLSKETGAAELKPKSADDYGKQRQDSSEAFRGQMTLHSLLLLADSALPLGSFAFSAGLESFLAHNGRQASVHILPRFSHFLTLSLASVAAMTLPYVHAAWATPDKLATLDQDIEASATCAVNKRASKAQGRAILSLWQRSFKSIIRPMSRAQEGAVHTFQSFADLATASNTRYSSQESSQTWDDGPKAHFPPLLGVLSLIMNVSLEQTLYLYLLNHVKMVLSAAVRASVIGPYQSQSLLASHWLMNQIGKHVEHQRLHPIEPSDAGQSVPSMDIWSGRHELVYSRIFNS